MTEIKQVDRVEPGYRIKDNNIIQRYENCYLLSSLINLINILENVNIIMSNHG